MMAPSEVIAALTPFLATFGAVLDGDQWRQYAKALADVNPGDLDDAMDELRKTHAFRNAPLPAEILRRCEDAARKRIAATLAARRIRPTDVKARDDEGEWKSFTLKGIGTLRMHVLPDDHPALPRYACIKCRDTSWEEIPNTGDTPKQPTCRRCACWQSNPVIAQQRSKDAEYQRRKAS